MFSLSVNLVDYEFHKKNSICSHIHPCKRCKNFLSVTIFKCMGSFWRNIYSFKIWLPVVTQLADLWDMVEWNLFKVTVSWWSKRSRERFGDWNTTISRKPFFPMNISLTVLVVHANNTYVLWSHTIRRHVRYERRNNKGWNPWTMGMMDNDKIWCCEQAFRYS